MVVTGSGIIGGSLAFTDVSSDNADASQIVLNDVIPLPLGISECVAKEDDEDLIECGVMKVIIDKNSNYPTNAATVFCQEPYDANELYLEIYEGENYYVADNYLLGSVVICGDIPERDPNICDNIMFEFIIDNNGIVNVEAKTNPEYEQDGQSKKYNIKINFESKDEGTLSKENIKHIKDKMSSWHSFSYKSRMN